VSQYEAYQLMVAGAAAMAAVLASNWRGLLWLILLCADMLVTGAYWRAGLPFADFITAMFDLAVTFVVYRYGRWRWEMWLWVMYQFSALVSIADLATSTLAPNRVSRDVYSVPLEVVNYLAFTLIGGVSGFAFRGRLDISAYRSWGRVWFLVHPLFREDAAAEKRWPRRSPRR